MKSRVFIRNRKYFAVSGILVVGIFLYMVVRLGFLYFSLQFEASNSLPQTIKQYGSLLMVMDELLMLSTIFCGWTIYNVRKLYLQNEKTLTGLLITSFILILAAWLLIVLKTGRLIYPINGLPAATGNNLQTTLAEIYATWHLCDILLGLFMVSWAGLLSHSFWKYSGIMVGLLQMLCTYFGPSIKPFPLLMAIILSTSWLLKVGISNVKEAISTNLH